MTTSRRDLLRRCAVLAAGAVPVDQLEILERLTHRKLFALGGMPAGWEHMGDGTYRCEVAGEITEQTLRNLPPLHIYDPAKVDLHWLGHRFVVSKKAWAEWYT